MDAARILVFLSLRLILTPSKGVSQGKESTHICGDGWPGLHGTIRQRSRFASPNPVLSSRPNTGHRSRRSSRRPCISETILHRNPTGNKKEIELKCAMRGKLGGKSRVGEARSQFSVGQGACAELLFPLDIPAQRALAHLVDPTLQQAGICLVHRQRERERERRTAPLQSLSGPWDTSDVGGWCLSVVNVQGIGIGIGIPSPPSYAVL